MKLVVGKITIYFRGSLLMEERGYHSIELVLEIAACPWRTQWTQWVLE